MASNLYGTILTTVGFGLALGVLPSIAESSAQGQIQEPRGTQEVVLIVDGSVKSDFQSGEEHLLQILVQRSEVPSLNVVGGARYPAPGEYLYVHVDAPNSLFGRIAGRPRTGWLPKPETRIRARLAVGERGRWEAFGEDWYEENPAPLADRSGQGAVDQDDVALGVVAQRASLGREVVLKTTQVVPDSPAANAGIEPGDILVKANGVALTSQDQLTSLFRLNRGNMTLTVRDVRTGKDVEVEIKSTDSSPLPDAAATHMKPLGVKTELAFYQGEAALKINSIEPGSPGQRAGLVPGLLILKANGMLLTKPEQLSEVEQQSRGRLELQVVDPSTRREQIIKITL